MNSSNETIERQLSVYNLERLRSCYVEFYTGETEITDEKYIRILYDEVSEILDENINDFADCYERLINSVPIMINCVEYGKTLYDYYSMVNTDCFIRIPENIAKLKSMSFTGDKELNTDAFILPEDIMRKLSEIFLDQFKQRYKGIYVSTSYIRNVRYEDLSKDTKDIIRECSVFSDNAIILSESSITHNIALMIPHDCDTYATARPLRYYVRDRFRLVKFKLEKIIKSSNSHYSGHNFEEMSGLSDEITEWHLYDYYKVIAEYLNTTKRFLEQNLQLVTNNDNMTMKLVSNK